jgi:hypothetical protein
MGLDSMPMYNDGQITKCPTCGYAVRLVFRYDNQLDHYEALNPKDMQLTAGEVNKPDTRTLRIARKARSGKKTVAMVGMAPAHCAFAPFDEAEVRLGGQLEIWGLNEEHSFSWMKKWTRWFQLHPSKYFTRITAARGVVGHYEWLQEKHDKPIYMQFKYAEIPDSVEYPLHDVIKEFFGKAWRGENNIKYFTNSLAFMMPMAIMEGFQRIELYGFEMANDEEYVLQRANAEFWAGVAIGRGIELYIPEGCGLLTGPMYAYEGQGPRNLV